MISCAATKVSEVDLPQMNADWVTGIKFASLPASLIESTLEKSLTVPFIKLIGR